ncbi:MAG: hypothetical protein R2710_12620 [Acidimicrobiales bacterium]
MADHPVGRRRRPRRLAGDLLDRGAASRRTLSSRRSSSVLWGCFTHLDKWLPAL